MEQDNFYKGLDLRTASQNDFCKLLKLTPVLVSVDLIKEVDIRVIELFAFAENYELKELFDKLNKLYPN
ncbi:hypothetical protein [Empedobacter sp. GD03739]|uniref:hypothetical protein n=1 Tax=Empedobacter sp. GD03739 TaxID=2975376 RepID=UPI00244CDE3D|nr:hypothetical protein [Empedobacter sp. GD03739]MDH1602242.1 hypothetical protein [Empedobacter sp. GD03739]